MTFLGEFIGSNCFVKSEDSDVLCIKNNKTGDEFFVDSKFFLALKQFNHSWHVDSVGYVRTSMLDRPFYIYLHHFILNVRIMKDSDVVVDHIDGNPLNCTINNLRIVSYSKNSVNNKKSKNRYIGVYFQSSTGTYKVSYKLDGHTVSLLCSSNEEECALVFDKFIYQTFGENTDRATNFSENRYPDGFLESKNLFSPSDILNYLDIKTQRIRNSKSNYYGIYPNKNGTIWDCWVTVNGRSKFIGQSKNELEAVKIREEWLDNHPENKSKRNVVLP